MRQLYDLIWFSGSGAKLYSHMGAACALEDAGIKAKNYGGVSGGAIVATLLATKSANYVKDELFKLKPNDIFTPSIFRSNGNLIWGNAVFGLFFSLGRGLAFLKLPPIIRCAIDTGILPDGVNLFTYLYNRKDAQVNIATYDDGMGWADVLEAGAQIPFLAVQQYPESDAGLEVHFPPQQYENELLFTVSDKPPSGKSAISQLRALHARVAWNNRKLQREEMSNVIQLPSFNGYTEYNAKSGRKSFDEAYKHTLESSRP